MILEVSEIDSVQNVQYTFQTPSAVVDRFSSRNYLKILFLFCTDCYWSIRFVPIGKVVWKSTRRYLDVLLTILLRTENCLICGMKSSK